MTGGRWRTLVSRRATGAVNVKKTFVVCTHVVSWLFLFIILLFYFTSFIPFGVLRERSGIFVFPCRVYGACVDKDCRKEDNCAIMFPQICPPPTTHTHTHTP